MINTVHTAPIPKRTVSGKWHFQVLLLYIWIAAIQMVCMHEFLETSCCWLESMTWSQVTNFVDLRLDLTCAKITWEFRIDLNIQFANYLHEKPSRFRTWCCLLSCPVPVHKTGTRLIPPTGHTLVLVWFSHPYAGVRPVCTGRSAIGLLSPDFPHTHTHTPTQIVVCWLVDDNFSFSQLYWWQLKNKNAKIAKALVLSVKIHRYIKQKLLVSLHGH